MFRTVCINAHLHGPLSVIYELGIRPTTPVINVCYPSPTHCMSQANKKRHDYTDFHHYTAFLHVIPHKTLVGIHKTLVGTNRFLESIGCRTRTLETGLVTANQQKPADTSRYQQISADIVPASLIVVQIPKKHSELVARINLNECTRSWWHAATVARSNCGTQQLWHAAT